MEGGTMLQSSVGSWDISALPHCPLSTSWAEGKGSPTTAFAAHTLPFVGMGTAHFLHFSEKTEVWRAKWFHIV